jgi:hypothetical protein
VRGCDTGVDDALLERIKTNCHGKLCAHPNGLPHKTRVYTVVPGFSPDHNLGVYNNSIGAVQRAFVERYFLCKTSQGFRPALPVQNGAYDSKWLKRFRRSVLAYMPKLPVLTLTETVSLFPAQKRKVYQRALESFEKAKLSFKDSRLSSFVKFEKQDVSKAPRIINPRTARYNLNLGRYLKHMEHHVFTSINKAFGSASGATVIKGFDADESARILRRKWDRFANPVAVGLDATKFDMHVSQTALKYEHSFYNEYWRSPELAKVLTWQLRNSGTAYCLDGKVEFQMKGTRCSGDVNTSLGNCIIMCGLVFAYAKELGLDVELANNGDDCVVFMDRSSLEVFRARVDEWFRVKGFELTVEATCFQFEEVEFCQTHPVLLSTGWRMIRVPSTVLKKDTMCLTPVQNIGALRKWFHAVGSGGISLNSGVPVLEEFYRMMKRNGRASGKFVEINPHKFARTSSETAIVNDEARVSFYMAFGLLPHRQVEMEKFLRNAEIGEFSGEFDRDQVVFRYPGNEILQHD